MSDARDAPFLGRGWRFPPAFGPGGASVETVAGDDDVHESLRILFATEPGERVLRERFGGGLAQFVFEEVGPTLLGRIRTAVTNAVLDHEPRVQLDAVGIRTLPTRPGQIEIDITYTVRETNSRFNLVYPFYLTEAASR